MKLEELVGRDREGHGDKFIGIPSSYCAIHSQPNGLKTRFVSMCEGSTERGGRKAGGS